MATLNQTKAGDERRNADHESFMSYKRMRWLKIALLLSMACLVSYFLVDVEPRHNGGSWYGYTLGTIGAGLIVWLSLLGVRKRKMSSGSWSLKAWTSAHVYLGLALLVVGTLHTGFQLGWNVHTLAYALMLLVIFSGIYGITVYTSLPAALSNNRQEMTRGQMVAELAGIERELETAGQPLEREEADLLIGVLGTDVFAAGFWERLSGNYPSCKTKHALDYFSDVSSSDADLEKVRRLLGRRKAQLDQIRKQMRLKALLEVWLFFHIPLTIALIAALAAHIISVFYYW